MNKIKETWLKIWSPIKTRWTAMNKKLKVGLTAGAAVILVSIIALIIIMNQTGYSVILTGLSNDEAAEILSYISTDLAVSDVRMNQNGDILVPDDRLEEIRVQLSIAGYPKTTFNYDVWDSGVSMFSTESDRREKQKQQLQNNLMATLSAFEGVDSAIVLLNIPEENNYVLSADSTPASAGIVLQLRNELSNDSIKGMYELVKNSVPGLLEENITISDGTGKKLEVSLIDPDAESDEATEEMKRLEIYYERLKLQNEIEGILTDSLGQMFDGFFRTFNVNVSVQLDYDNKVTESTEYTPSVDEAGTSGGMISNETDRNAAGGVAAEGGLVGTTVDADIAPDYPTLTVGEDGEFYYESSHETNYLVNEQKTQVEKNGYEIKKLTASVVVDADTMTAEEEERWLRIIATSIGANSLEDVSIIAAPALLTNDSTTDGTLVAVTSSRDTLIGVIIALGALLLILLLLAFTLSGSKKRRRISAQRAAIAQATSAVTGTMSAGAMMEGLGDSDTGTGSGSGGRIDDEFELHSLTEDDSESKEAVLKREIRDFARTNPEIVAQLIRTWMRPDD